MLITFSTERQFLMHGPYSLVFPGARFVRRQTAICPNGALLQNFRIPNTTRVKRTQWDKRLVHAGETQIQPRVRDSEGFRLQWTRKVEVPIGGRTLVFDSLWLRDACTCERCIDQSTTQKLFNTLDIPLAIRGKDLEVHPDGSFSISWTSDIPGYEDHRSYFPKNFSQFTWDVDDAVKRLRRYKYPRELWNRARLEDRRLEMNVTYDDYMTNEKVYHKVVQDLFQYGISFIVKVPNILESVAEIGNRMGGLKNTIYGPTWDVRSLPFAKNVANTSSDLGFHMVSRYPISETDDGPNSLSLLPFLPFCIDETDKC